MKPAPPYRFPSADVVRAGPWTVELDGRRLALPSVFPTWDFATDIVLEREVEVDLAEALRASALGDDAALVLGVLWRSTASELRGPATVAVLDEPSPVRLTAELPGRRLGGTLELETVLMLSKARDAEPWTAFRAGSVVWTDRKRCKLQGDAPMFPIEIADFRPLGLDTRAPWHLEVRDDLDSPAMGAIHLLVNRDIETVVAAVAHAGHPDEAEAKVLSAMYADVGRTLVEFALNHGEFGTDVVFEDETLGAALNGTLKVAFRGESAENLRKYRAADVTRWSSRSNAAFGLFDE